MLGSNRGGTLRSLATLLLTTSIWACTDANNDDTNTTPSGTTGTNTGTTDATALVGPYDGVYTVAFISGGIQAALGVLNVQNNAFSGDLANVFSELFEVSGYIDELGNFNFEPIVGNFGSEIVADANIESGLISGTYTIGDRTGSLTGSLGDSPFELYPVTEFDGSYEVALIYQGDEISQTAFTVEDGKFEAVVVTTEDAEFELTGFVTTDGTIVISQLAGDATTSELLAEGNIDHDTGEIFGMYRVGPFTGNVVGRLAD